MGVKDDDLFLWIERLRKWLGNTIMVKLAKEIDNINSQLRKISSEDTEIGGTVRDLFVFQGFFKMDKSVTRIF